MGEEFPTFDKAYRSRPVKRQKVAQDRQEKRRMALYEATNSKTKGIRYFSALL
jgi:hypothetical protein